MGILWESAKTIYTYVEQSGISVEDLDIQVHVYTFPMTKDFLTYCKENDYTFHATKGSGDDVDILMSYPHYDFTYTDIDSLEWVTNCTEETKFSVGTCASAGFNFSIFSEKYLDDGTEVNYEDISFKAAVVIPVYDFSYGDTLIAQKQLGIFHVTEYEKEAGMINFTCLDNMRFLDKKATKIANFITVPLKSDVLMANILTKVNLRMGAIPGVKYFQVNKVDHLKKLTFRTIFGYATEPIGAFAYANYIGNICAKCFNVSDAATVTIPYDNIIDDKSSGAGVKINGFEIQYGDNMVSGFLYDEGEEEIEVPVPLTVDNPLFIKKKQDSLEIIGNRLDSRMNGFTFEPYEVTTFLPNFYIEAGDFVNVEDKNGVMHKILVSQLTWRDNLEMEIVSACETEGDESSFYDSDVNEAIQRNENIDSVPIDDDNENDVLVYMTYTGRDFNDGIKTLASGSYQDFDDIDEIITGIEVTNEKPRDGVATKEFADTERGQVLTAYMDGTVVKLYTEADIIMLPEDSSYMFASLHALIKLDLSRFSTEHVINMKNMFAWTWGLEEINLGGDFNTSNVTNMYGMFNGTFLLKMLNLGNKFDTSNVTDMSYMFNSIGYRLDYEDIFSLDLGDKFDTSNVTNMSNMFFYAVPRSLEVSLNLGNKFNTSNVTDMHEMFYGSFLLAGKSFVMSKIDFDLTNATDITNMFYDFGFPKSYYGTGGYLYKLDEPIRIDLGEKFIITDTMALGNYPLAVRAGIILQVPQSTYDLIGEKFGNWQSRLEVR